MITSIKMCIRDSHNTARSAEDNAGTSGFSHGVVERAIQHQRKTYISPFDKSGELAGGDRVCLLYTSIRYGYKW